MTFRRINAAFIKIKQLYLDGGNRWITDNFYLISRNYDGLKKSKSILSKHSDLLEYCEKYCKRYSFSLDLEKLCSFFSSYANQEDARNKLSFTGLSSVPLFLAACSILEIARSENCGSAVELLRRLGSEDFEEFVECVSPAEKLLEGEYSGEYKKMDNATKSAYRHRIEELSIKNKTSYNNEAERLCNLSHEKQLHIGHLLFPKQKIKSSFFILEGVVFAALMALCICFCGWLSALAIFPIYKSASTITDFIYSIITRLKPNPYSTVFRFEDEYVKDKTLVLITTLLFGGLKDEELFKRLERFYLSNRRENHIFGVLGDFKDGELEEKDEDSEIISSAQDAIDRLNQKYGGGFVLLARKRVRNADGAFGGRERKRGAVTDAVLFLRGKSETIEYFSGKTDDIKDIKYLLTLDADTNLSLGAVSELLCAAVHPLSKPISKDGRVVSGWALFQPAMAVSLESASKTAFSKLLGGSGGVDAYQSASYDKYQNILGEGVFCGKGLFDVDCFYNLVVPTMPDGFVLSHDLPEGAILRTRLVSDVILSDSAPQSVLSYYGRAGRWIRGDVQNIKLIPKVSSPVGRYMIIQNIISVLLPISIFVSIALTFILSLLNLITIRTSAIALIFFLSSIFLPSILGIVGTPSRLFRRPKRRYFSKISHSLKRDLTRLFFELSAASYAAQITTIATLRSIYRLFFSKKKLLEWVTAGEGEQGRDFPSYAARMLPTAIFGSLMFLFSPFWGYKLLGLSWFFFPVFSYTISRNLVDSQYNITENQKQYLFSQSELMWGFFTKYVNEETNHLPPDNVQLEPVYARADRTSPTNIGMYLLSCLAAADFGFIATDELEKRLTDTLNTIDKLEKWNGHLYNWYATDTLEIIGGDYISTVDSGNFVTAVCAVVEGLKEYGLNELSERYSPSCEADFSALYNSKKALFSLGREGKSGIDGKNSEIYYDLYMSEARTTSFYSLAKGYVPKKHWCKLTRTLISSGGYIGMASWTGTTFEYFMPPLLLPVYKNSFEYEALRFAFEQQRKKTVGADGVWGVSESAFFSFDSEMNYQYKAFGVQKLRLKRYLADEAVISPYSSFLMLRMGVGKCISNLKRLVKYGMLGEYGLYEACDFTPTRTPLVKSKGKGENIPFAIIKSYMAHHIGMSLTATANACFADVFVRRFMRNPQMGAAYELLQEKVPDVSIYKDIAPEAKAQIPPPNARIEGKSSSHSLRVPEMRLINSGRLTLLVGDLGHTIMRFGNVFINECDYDLYASQKGMSITLADKGFVPTGNDDGAVFTIEERDGDISHIRSSSDFSGRVRYSVQGKSIRIETLAPDKNDYSAKLEFPIALDDERAFVAHPAFSKLSVSAEYLEDERIILYTRKPKGKIRPPYLAVALAEKDIEFSFDTRLVDINDFSGPLQGRTGAAINPYLRIETEAVSGGRVCFLISCCSSREEALKAIKSARNEYRGENDKKSYKQNPIQPKALSKVLGAIYFSHAKERPSLSHEDIKGDIHSLWRYGISGDYPILLVDTNDDSSIYESLQVFIALTIASIRCELVIIVREADRYARESRRSAMKAINLLHCEGFVGKRGGIFIFDFEEIVIDGEDNYNFLLANSVDIFSMPEPLENEDNTLPVVITTPTKAQEGFKIDSLKVEGGGFDIDGGFIVDKYQNIPLEWSYITANRIFGSVQTQNSLGYTYYRNASKYRLTEFSNNPYFANTGERILLFYKQKAFDVCAISHSVRFGNGKVIWKGVAEDIDYELTLFVCSRMPLKLMHLKHNGKEDVRISLVLRPEGGNMTEMVIGGREKNAICFRSLRRFTGVGKKAAIGFAGIVSGFEQQNTSRTVNNYIQTLSTDFSALFGNKTGRRDCAAISSRAKETWFYFGGAPDYKAANRIISMIDIDFVEEEIKEAELAYKSLLPPQKDGLKSEFSVLYNHFLPYQVAISRFFARCAYYQVGGAYGYRDQLQDSLMLMKTRPELVRTHIIRCCAHQYVDGSVQHWWHPPREGIKSKCSDDFLWLPLITAAYVKETGDRSVLDVNTRWLVSPPLREDESERYEIASSSEFKDDVYTHCVRALERSINFGKHGLPLMGSCDWNDGFSELGVKGIGESVFSAWLFIWAVREFSVFMDREEDNSISQRLKNAAASVLGAIESYCFDGDRYIRAFTDEGEVLGSPNSGEAEIDILPQCMPAVVGSSVDEARLDIALDMAYSLCFDRKWQIVKLFTPPFDKDTRKIGYIQSYVPGIRENGGQYTHAAMWMALGLWRAGKKDKAFEVAKALNPVIRCQNKELAKAYKIEPYVMAGDIYSNVDHPGRGGWSWYTGAAAWYWILLEEMFSSAADDGLYDKDDK